MDTRPNNGLVKDSRIDGFDAINFNCRHDRIIDISTPHKFIIKPDASAL